jgi:PhzF family phenazine biosynthesis protein
VNIDYIHVSAFTAVPGRGNSAAVCELDEWPGDEQLSRIARAISLPVTSCLVTSERGLELRWLSKAGSFVQSMCGHGTLAASLVVALREPKLREFSFLTPGGTVTVERADDLFFLALPKWSAIPMEPWPELTAALGARPAEVLDAGRDVMAVYKTEDEVRSLEPDMKLLLALGRRGFIATAPGTSYDCVSRFFCPSFGLGVDEDPVTGSAHCSIAPLWAERLNKSTLSAYQASSMGGELLCRVSSDAVTIGAPATLLSRGFVTI